MSSVPGGETTTEKRCTCYVRGEHGEHPRKRVIPHIVSRRLGRAVYFPPVETDDPQCPVHGIAGRKILRAINAR